MSPEPTNPVRAVGDARRTPSWVDALLGVVIALPIAVIISQINQATYRTGALAVAVLVVTGLAISWRASAAASPVMFAGLWIQNTKDLGDLPEGRNAVGLLMFAISCLVVVIALRRWEGDRRNARAATDELVRSERRLITLVDFGQRLASMPDRAGVFQVVAEELPRMTGCVGVFLVTMDGNRTEFSLVHGHDPTKFPQTMPDEIFQVRTPAVDAFLIGKPVFVRQASDLVEQYAGLSNYQSQSGHQAWAAIPVPDVGSLVLSFDEPQPFSTAQRAYLVTAGSIVGAAAQRVQEAERSELERLAGALDVMLDGVGIHRAVRDSVGRIVDFEIEYLNPSAVNLQHDRSGIIGRRLRDLLPDSPLVDRYAEVVETGEPLVLDDVDTVSIGAGPSPTTSVSIRASRLDPERLLLVVRDVSERAALIREIQDANRGFSVAQELARVGNWRYDFTTDRLQWSQELYRICGIAEGTALPRPGDGGLFAYEHPEDRGRVEAAIASAVTNKEPFSFDVRIIRQSDGDVRDTTTSGIVLTDETGAISTIWGATQDVTERRRAEKVRREMVSQLVQTRLVVAELQQVLLPAEMPEMPGATLTAHYRAANIEEVVGGDWYDAFTGPDGRTFMVVGDVAGHGIGCATLANQLRVSIRVRVQDGRNVSEVLRLTDGELDDAFATCWLGAYDCDTRALTVANAGHLPAVLLRSGECSFIAGHTRPPLGTGSGRPDHFEITLLPGDVVVVFTDGLVERRAESIEHGLERLRDAITEMGDGADPGLSLITRLAVDAQDDVCVLTLRVGEDGAII